MSACRHSVLTAYNELLKCGELERSRSTFVESATERMEVHLALARVVSIGQQHKNCAL